jgi:disulfide bond formation protein DsbB
MSTTAIAMNRTHPAVLAAFLIAGVGAATILGAYYFQYVLGYAPCTLCLQQRIPYYVGIPLALVVAVAALREAPRPLVMTGLALLAVVMLIGAGVATYHAGIEWKLWPGPRDCTGTLTSFGSASSLLDQMRKTKIVPCDVAAWRFLGVSLAGYNTLVSLALAAVALWGIKAQKH